VITKTLAAEVLVAEPAVLEHDAHRAVEDRDPLPEQLIETLLDRGRDFHK
jgi:hypothetical protein